MDAITDPHLIQDRETLEALYGEPSEPALLKEVDYVHPHYRAFIEAAPFVAIATSGPGGMDVSPRGDPAGFITVENPKTLLVPDRRGNNRTDTLHNLIGDDRIALLFLVPGVNETLRVNGRAQISTDPALLERFPAQGKLPRSVLIVHVESVYFQCGKALIRSDLWNPDKRVPRSALPSTGTILRDVSAGKTGGEEYDRAYPERLKQTLY